MYIIIAVILTNILMMAHCKHYIIDRISKSIPIAIQNIGEKPIKITFLSVSCSLSFGFLVYCAKNIQFMRDEVPKNGTIDADPIKFIPLVKAFIASSGRHGKKHFQYI